MKCFADLRSICVSWFEWNVICNVSSKRSGTVDGNTSVQLRSITVRSGRNWFLWPWHRLLHLGWAGSLRFSKIKPRSEQNHGHVGILDARFHAVHYGCLPVDRSDVV